MVYTCPLEFMVDTMLRDLDLQIQDAITGRLPPNAKSLGFIKNRGLRSRTKTKRPQQLAGGVRNNKPDDDLLSHWLQHYHRRGVVSRSCSGWEGVVPTRYCHQA
jgi:hypothetical protein